MSEERWLKAELHSHCSLDPLDYGLCSHTPEDLISQAARLGYHVLAITCHNRDVWTRELSEYAAALGVTLIPGMEVSVEGRRHVLAYNFRTGPENLSSFRKIRERAREDTMVVAAHPYFPGRICMRDLLEENLDLFDAIEYSGFHVPGIDFNRRAGDLSRRFGKPLIGNGDVHLLWQLDRTFTWIYSRPEVVSILNAVKLGKARVETTSLIYPEAARWWITAFWRRLFPVNVPPTPGVGGLEPEQLL